MTTATSPLRVSSAQEAVDLLYNHFIKNRHRPAYCPGTIEENGGGYCFAMPHNAVYPRCAIGILTKPSAIRDPYRSFLPHPDDDGVYLSNNPEAMRLLNSMAPRLGYNLQNAHDQAAHRRHQSITLGNVWYCDHQSFRAAFATSLRSICTHYNLEYPGDR